MAPKKAKSLSLFEVIEIQEGKEDPKNCKHFHEEKSLTIWPGYEHKGKCLTMTCKGCGRVRGRYPFEGV